MNVLQNIMFKNHFIIAKNKMNVQMDMKYLNMMNNNYV